MLSDLKTMSNEIEPKIWWTSCKINMMKLSRELNQGKYIDQKSSKYQRIRGYLDRRVSLVWRAFGRYQTVYKCSTITYCQTKVLYQGIIRKLFVCGHQHQATRLHTLYWNKTKRQCNRLYTKNLQFKMELSKTFRKKQRQPGDEMSCIMAWINLNRFTCDNGCKKADEDSRIGYFQLLNSVHKLFSIYDLWHVINCSIKF